MEPVSTPTRHYESVKFQQPDGRVKTVRLSITTETDTAITGYEVGGGRRAS